MTTETTWLRDQLTTDAPVELPHRFAIGAIVRLACARPGGYAATIGARARITGDEFMLPSGRTVAPLVWLDHRTANGQKDGAYVVWDFEAVDAA